MTGSWTMDSFFIGAAILIVVPLGIWFFKEAQLKKGSDTK
ncbi:hypothetical protein TICRE_16250 [Tissierella creatinophila DSM 6911]|uniref:Uncharacterized protein n=1 Tax=Tissierella creatinophila DSM 6911 TaxID=1123403 RepID=A0A1U7M546_TISCR|nr:hypothetical protein TICRE_16250 [Tissierella creatinophila DSM 6911]